MKFVIKLFTVFILLFSVFNYSTWAYDFSSMFWGSTEVDIWVDCWWPWQETCLNKWVDLVWDEVTGIETERSLSEYIQAVVAYILTFLSVIAVIYIIYAWFRILTWAWDEETLKKQKTTVLHVVIWMLLIWLSYSIVIFIIDVLNN